MRKQDERAFFLMSWALLLGGFYVLFTDIFYGLIMVMIGLGLNYKVRALFLRKYNFYFNPDATKHASSKSQKIEQANKIPFNFGPILKRIKKAIRGKKV